MYINNQKGLYIPRFPEKYVGDPTKIRYMSSWEYEFHKFLDGNLDVIKWSSEEIAIPYIKPTDGKIHKYYPDYWVLFKDKKGNICQEIIEVKPAKKLKPPHGNSKHKLYESVEYAINIAKWKACEEWCKKHGMTFRIVTENKIFK